MNHRLGKYYAKYMQGKLRSHPDELKKLTRKMGRRRQLTDEQIQKKKKITVYQDMYKHFSLG